MPELPEVETVRRGLTKHLINQKIQNIIVRERRLRWPIELENRVLVGQTVQAIERRSKYLILHLERGFILVHLGMSGYIRLVSADHIITKHDHCDFIFENNLCLRFNDARRFGAILYSEQMLGEHVLLKHLGPEPLSSAFSAEYFFKQLHKINRSIKLTIMDNAVVVGVGNIYANESLFKAKISPLRLANTLTSQECQRLITSIQSVLTTAIEKGSATLKDFKNSAGKPGYFQQELFVYGRENKPCKVCQQPLIQIRMQNRTTVYCQKCQL